MDTVQIKFTSPGWSSSVGSFAAGDTLRCSAAQAAHFVDDAACAQYLPPPQASAQATPTDEPAPKPPKGKAKAAATE